MLLKHIRQVNSIINFFEEYGWTYENGYYINSYRTIKIDDKHFKELRRRLSSHPTNTEIHKTIDEMMSVV